MAGYLLGIAALTDGADEEVSVVESAADVGISLLVFQRGESQPILYYDTLVGGLSDSVISSPYSSLF